MNQFKSAKIVKTIFAIIILLLVSNIVYLGITGNHLLSGENIATFAKGRSKKETISYAARGQIYTSDGEAVATNVKKYKMIAILSSSRPGYGKKAAHITDVTKTANAIAPILNIDANELAASIQSKIDAGKYQMEFGSAGNNLSAGVKKQIEALGLTGLEFEESNSRFYPLGDFCSYVVGYAKSYEDNSVKKMVGEMGLELVYDDTLKGSNGYKVYQTDAKGYTLVDGILKEKDSTDGDSVYLTLDSGLQRDLDYLMSKAYQESGAEVATCGVMEVKTGKILAMSSYPSFDPNERNITDYNNYFLEGTFECGSVFKPFVYADSMEEGKYDHNATYNSGKYDVSYNGKLIATIRDHNNGAGWGAITYDEGLYHSSNVAICNLLDKGFVTKDVLKDKLKQLGFFQSDKLDGLTTTGSIAAYDITDNRLEYLTTGFGQGSTTSAYQLLKAYSVFGNDGKTVKPYIVDKIVSGSTGEVTYTGKSEYSEQIFSSNTISQMKDLLLGVIENPVGTGKNYKLEDGTLMMGKTGTGQVSSDTGGYRSDIHMHSFTGLAPYDDPQVEIFITFKCGENYSQYTTSIVKQIMTEALQVVNRYNTTTDTLVDNSYKLDNYTNQSTAYVKSKLESKSLIVQTIGNGNSVLEQYPIANTSVASGDRIFLKTDDGEITIPNMVGWSRKDVSSFASLAKINITIEGNSGMVTGQSVGENTVVHEGDAVTVTLTN